LDEKAHLWMLPAQRSLYYTRESDFEAEPLVTGVTKSLDVVSNNKFTWMLQTTNFFYKNYIEDPARLIVGEVFILAVLMRLCVLLFQALVSLTPIEVIVPLTLIAIQVSFDFLLNRTSVSFRCGWREHDDMQRNVKDLQGMCGPETPFLIPKTCPPFCTSFDC
jgi:hypothetical protein